VMHRITETK